MMPEDSALSIWREKLAYLQRERALVTDANAKFSIEKQIEELRQTIAELQAEEEASSGGDVSRNPVSRLISRLRDLLLDSIFTNAILAVASSLTAAGIMSLWSNLPTISFTKVISYVGTFAGVLSLVIAVMGVAIRNARIRQSRIKSIRELVKESYLESIDHSFLRPEEVKPK